MKNGHSQDVILAIMAEVPPGCRKCLCLMKYVSMRKISKHRTEITYRCPKCKETKVETR